MSNLLSTQPGKPSASKRHFGAGDGWGAGMRAQGGFNTFPATPTAGAQTPVVATSGAQTAGHPLQDTRHNIRLLDQENEIKRAFADIEAIMADIGGAITGADAAERIQAIAQARLGFEFPVDWLNGSWSRPVNVRRLFAYSVFKAFEKLAARKFDRQYAEWSDGESAPELIQKWGFHAIDITPCADGRLSGVVDYILRVPPTVVTSRKSFAGAMFDVEENVRCWADVELRRHREGVPNAADEPTRYLKIGVYHTSSSDPSHEGCAAHGSDERQAAQALLDRVNAFQQAVENSYCCGATVATLLIGVDTDTDAIKVHIPDAAGALSLDRYVDNADMFETTRSMSREQAKDAIRATVARVAGVADDDAATEGMRWFAGYLLKNNMAQIEYVRAYHDGRYPDLGHTERFITVGDSFDDVQMRNLAYQAQMETVEEGAADMDVGIKIFKGLNIKNDLPVPVFVHFQYSGAVPGARERAVARGLRLEQAIRDRYAGLVSHKWLYTFVSVRDQAGAGPIEMIEGAEFNTSGKCSCSCQKKD